MKVKTLSKDKNSVRFLLSDTTPAFANALRRVMVSEVPTLAIEDVEMHQNTSGLFDEVIAHRLGLIPLKFNPKTMNIREECTCKGKGCGKCQVVLVLKKKGPGVIKAGDMKSSDPKVKPVDPEIPIVELIEGQELKFEATAVLGKGQDHAKWQAANVGYKFYPKLKVNSKKGLSKAVKECPKGVLKKSRSTLKFKDPEKCSLCLRCEEVAGIEIETDPSKVIFQVESISGLSPKQIVNNAVEIIDQKAKAFAKEVRKEVKGV